MSGEGDDVLMSSVEQRRGGGRNEAVEIEEGLRRRGLYLYVAGWGWLSVTC